MKDKSKETFVSILRRINVGGQKKIKMADLIALYESLGLNNIKTYVQSGNVIFDSPKGTIKELSKMIEEKIKQEFGFLVAVILRTPRELEQIIDDNPFLKERDVDIGRLYVTFLSEVPGKPILNQIQEIHDESDKFIILNKEAYLYCPGGYGRTKFSNNFFEKKLRVTATTRNWNTVNALLDMAKN